MDQFWFFFGFGLMGFLFMAGMALVLRELRKGLPAFRVSDDDT